MNDEDVLQFSRARYVLLKKSFISFFESSYETYNSEDEMKLEDDTSEKSASLPPGKFTFKFSLFQFFLSKGTPTFPQFALSVQYPGFHIPTFLDLVIGEIKNISQDIPFLIIRRRRGDI